jgi:hypothetical protein
MTATSGRRRGRALLGLTMALTTLAVTTTAGAEPTRIGGSIPGWAATTTAAAATPTPAALDAARAQGRYYASYGRSAPTNQATKLDAARAQGAYYASYGRSAPTTQATKLDAAKAQGAYYASYGHPAPIASAATATSEPSRPSWLGFALAACGALLAGMAAGAAGGAVATRRRRTPGFAR